ncbi:hypothetical protein ARMSODRAFT_975862 [Armillaria solidipes]|uniref:Uncharacterized protein n=1 Tax=Armillaria solidipes TaxID=1076256 RepID=A0A2H3BZI2_9AGAR|nr:hypothetical protein ARMSODRAFT_975862 [Armillaria solidipes]
MTVAVADSSDIIMLDSVNSSGDSGRMARRKDSLLLKPFIAHHGGCHRSLGGRRKVVTRCGDFQSPLYDLSVLVTIWVQHLYVLLVVVLLFCTETLTSLFCNSELEAPAKPSQLTFHVRCTPLKIGIILQWLGACHVDAVVDKPSKRIEPVHDMPEYSTMTDRMNTLSFFQPMENALYPFNAPSIPSLNTRFLNTVEFDADSPLDAMDPRTFSPSSSDFSSLDEDFPAVNDIMHGSHLDFSWCGNIGSPDDNALQSDVSHGVEDVIDEDDNDNDSCNADGPVTDISHWQYATTTMDDKGTTWAQQNLNQPVLPVQTHRGNASKETCNLQGVQARARHKAFSMAIETAKCDVDAILQCIADQHGKKINVIKQLAFSQTWHHYQCAISLHDAKISWKMKQEKDKLLPGEKPKTLAEIQALVKDDNEMDNWPKETQEKMIQRVREIRGIKAQGMQISNHAAAMDYRKTVDRVEQELSNLVPRTGAMMIAIFTRVHVDDTFAPNIFASSGAEDLVRKFEQSRGSRHDIKFTKGHYKQDPGKSMIHHQETNSFDVLLPLKSPSEIRVLADLKLLRNTLIEGSCQWIHLSQPVVQEHIDEHQRCAESGETQSKKRKAHLDKGRKHGLNK